MWVVVTHILSWCGFAEAKLPFPFSRFWFDFLFAQPAVETFIILSGFAISSLLHKPQSYGSFIRGRFFRIYPIYFVCLILGVATTFVAPFILNTATWRTTLYFEWVGAGMTAATDFITTHVLWHISLLHGLLPKPILPHSAETLLPPAWSISLEWQYYLVAPYVARMLRSATGFLVVAVVAALGVKFGVLWNNPQLAFLPAQLPLFLIGIGSYHVYVRLQTTTTAPYAAPIYVAILLSVAFFTRWHLISLSVWALGFGSVFHSGNDLFSRGLFIIRRVLLSPALQFIGRISYPLYLVHWPLIIGCLSLLLLVNPLITSNQAALVMMGVSLPISIVIANVLHKSVEMPFMAFGKRLQTRLTVRMQANR